MSQKFPFFGGHISEHVSDDPWLTSTSADPIALSRPSDLCSKMDTTRYLFADTNANSLVDSHTGVVVLAECGDLCVLSPTTADAKYLASSGTLTALTRVTLSVPSCEPAPLMWVAKSLAEIPLVSIEAPSDWRTEPLSSITSSTSWVMRTITMDTISVSLVRTQNDHSIKVTRLKRLTTSLPCLSFFRTRPILRPANPPTAPTPWPTPTTPLSAPLATPLPTPSGIEPT